jgi:outer membrane protein assembly factor BamB
MNKLIIFLLSLSIFFEVSAQSTVGWPNSRGNASMTGVTTASFPQKAKLKWSYDADGIFKSAPVISDGKIVVGSTNGDLLCLDMNGKLLWKFKTDNSIEAPALIQGGTVYTGNLSGTLVAIDLKTGTKKWEYKTDNQISGAPAYTELNGKKIITVGSYDYFLHGVDALTGKGLWKYESENYINGSPAISNGKAVFGGCDGFLHLVNLKDGKLDGKIQVATYVASSPAISENRAYVGDYDGGFSCFDLAQKKLVWKYENKEAAQPFISSPSISDDKIVIGSRDKFVYCFNKANGSILWKVNTGNRIDASTVVNKKQALVVNMRGDVMLLDLKTGKPVWTYELGVAVMNTPAVFEGAIVLAGSDGNIYFLSNEK